MIKLIESLVNKTYIFIGTGFKICEICELSFCNTLIQILVNTKYIDKILKICSVNNKHFKFVNWRNTNIIEVKLSNIFLVFVFYVERISIDKDFEIRDIKNSNFLKTIIWNDRKSEIIKAFESSEQTTKLAKIYHIWQLQTTIYILHVHNKQFYQIFENI